MIVQVSEHPAIIIALPLVILVFFASAGMMLMSGRAMKKASDDIRTGSTGPTIN